MRRPVNSPYQITQPFGYDPNYPLNNGVHKGVDYVSNDHLVIAPESGTVQVKPNDGTCGNAIYLSTRNTYHAFCHLSEFKVQNGQVTEGQVLGVMGQTGAATGVHLHWAVRFNGELIDPESIISKENNMPASDDIVDANIVQLGYNLIGVPNPDPSTWETRIKAKQTVSQFLSELIGSKQHKDMLQAQQDVKNNPALQKLEQIKKIIEKG